MTVDWAALGRRMVADRGKKSQAAYGAEIGLSQGQVSDIERAKMRRLSAEVADVLKRRLGDLPIEGEKSKDRVEDRDVESLAAHARREFADLLHRVEDGERAKIVGHLKDQISLLARLAAALAQSDERTVGKPTRGPLRRKTGT